jgi:hypothetical protein
MRKSILVIVLMLVLLPMVTSAADSTATKPTAPFYTSLSDAKAAAMSKDKPFLVDFYAVW